MKSIPAFFVDIANCNCVSPEGKLGFLSIYFLGGFLFKNYGECFLEQASYPKAKEAKRVFVRNRKYPVLIKN